MKIALLNPCQDNAFHSEVPAALNRHTAQLPPLGLMYLHAYLAAKTTHSVTIIDAPAEGLSYPQLECRLREGDYDILGITGHTHNLVDMLLASRLARKIDPAIRVVWGGPHANAFPRECLTFPEVDLAVYGEGEETFAALLAALESGRDLNDQEGVVYRHQGQVVVNPPRPLIHDLDALPFPDRKSLDHRHYFYLLNREQQATSILTSRGCPYRCTFCSTPGRQFRSRSATNVVDEFAACAELGIRELNLVDDTFNVDAPRVMEICDQIRQRKLNLSWNVRARINLLSLEMLENLEAAGCTRIQLGVETSTDQGLKVLAKGITLEQVRSAFRWLKKTRITSTAYFMIGCPHEKTREDVLRTIDLARELDPDYCLFGILTPYPDTAIYQEGVKRGILDPQRWQNFVTNPDRNFKPQVWTEYLDEAELLNLLDLAYKRFYLRPGPIWRKVREVKGPADFWRKFKAGLSIARL